MLCVLALAMAPAPRRRKGVGEPTGEPRPAVRILEGGFRGRKGGGQGEAVTQGKDGKGMGEGDPEYRGGFGWGSHRPAKASMGPRSRCLSFKEPGR